MTRKTLIELLRRQVYGSFPSQDSTITDNLVNLWVIQGTALAAKKNYTDNFQLEGVAYINNSFYSTFKGILITNDEDFLWKFTLPSIPLGVGSVDGISRLVFKDADNKVSYPAVLLSENQVSIQHGMRPIPNKVLAYPEGGECFIITAILMDSYTATVTMVSGGDENDLSSTVNVPNDFIPTIVTFVQQQLSLQRNMPVNNVNDGSDVVKST